MLTLNKFLKSNFKNKKIPIDFKKMCEEEHFSQSKNKYISLGEMEICHILRSFKKQINVYKFRIKELVKEEEEKQKIEEFEKWLDTCPIEWHTSRHPSSEIKTINFEL